MSFCPKCGYEGIGDEQFCADCGSRIGRMNSHPDQDDRPLFSPRSNAGRNAVAVILVVFLLILGFAAASTYVRVQSEQSPTTTQVTQQLPSASTISSASDPSPGASLSTTSSSATASSSGATSTYSTTATTSSSAFAGPLSITILAAIVDPPEAGPGNSLYIYNVTITDEGRVPYAVDEAYFSLLTNSNDVYNPTLARATQQYLAGVGLSPGESTSGQIVFQFPASQTPSKIEYRIPETLDELITNLPYPNTSVSSPGSFVTTVVQGTPNASGAQDLSALASIQNSSRYFYTGQTIAIKVALYNYNPGTTVTATSVSSATSGVRIEQVSPTLPVAIRGDANGNETDVTVYVTAPANSVSSTLTLVITGTG